MTAVIGALRVVLGINTASYEAGLTRAQGKTRAAVGGMEGAFNRVAGVATRAMAGIGAAMAAVQIAQGLGRMASAALEYASSLSETAQQIGVTVEQLQILQRIAGESGLGTEQLNAGMMRLTRTIGQANSGSRAAQGMFARLGISREQVAQWRQGGDGIRVIAERIAALRNPAQEAARSFELFGRAGQQWIPALHGIAEGYDAVREAAIRSGLITNEQAEKADRFADTAERLATVLKTRMAASLADHSEGMTQLVTLYAGATSQMISWAATLARWHSAAGGFISRRLEEQGRLIRVGLMQLGLLTDPSIAAGAAVRGVSGSTSLGQMGRDARLTRQGRGRQWQANQGRAWTFGGAPAAPGGGGGGGDDGGGGGSTGGGGGGGPSLDEQAQRAQRQAYELAGDVRRLQIETLRASQSQTDTAEMRADNAARILAIEREQYRAEVEMSVSTGQRLDWQAEALLDEARTKEAAEDIAATAERTRAMMAERVGIIEAQMNVAAEGLRAEVNSADTASERRAAELRLLEATEALEDIRRVQVLMAGTPEEQAAAWAEYGRRDAQGAERRGAIARGTRGPLEEWLAGIPQSAAAANEALQAVAANGLQSIEDGLLAVITGTKGLKSAFKDMALSILADLLKIQIRRAIVAGLDAVLGGKGGSGFMSLFGGGGGGGAGKVFKPFAHGGSFRVGGLPGVDKNLMGLALSRGETVDITPAGRGGRGPYFDLRGAVMTEDLLRQMNQIGDAAATRGAVGGARMAGAQNSRRARRAL